MDMHNESGGSVAESKAPLVEEYNGMLLLQDHQRRVDDARQDLPKVSVDAPDGILAVERLAVGHQLMVPGHRSQPVDLLSLSMATGVERPGGR